MLPQQKIAEKDKDKDWHLDSARAIVQWWQNNSERRMTTEAKERCYKVISNDFDWTEFDYVTRPYGIDVHAEVGEMPARLREYNLIKNKVETLQGEELIRPFDFLVQSVFGEGLNERQEYKKQLFFESLSARLAQMNGGQADPNAPQPEQINEIAGRQYRSLKESALGQILKVLQQQSNLKLHINQGFQHGLIAAEELYRVGIKNKEPYVRTVHPLMCGFRLSAESNDVSKSDLVVERRTLTPSEILEEIGGRIPEEDFTTIANRLMGSLGMAQNFGAVATPLDVNRGTAYGALYSSTDRIDVHHCFWKAYRKIYYVEYLSENGQLKADYVDSVKGVENISKKEEIWKPEIRYATIAGADILLEWGLYEIDFATLKNPFEVRMPYRGCIYGILGTRAQSFTSSTLPYLYLYLIVWYKIELEIIRAKSSVIQYDISLLPKDMSMEEQQYYADNTGFSYVESMAEGQMPGSITQRTSFDATKQLDRGISQNIRFYLDVASRLEQIIDMVSGVAQQRQGVVSNASETATATNTAITYSQSSTAYLFYYHQQAKKDMLEGLLEVAKTCYANTEYGAVLFNEDTLELIRTEGLDFNDTDFGIYLTDDSETFRLKQKVEQYAEAALSGGKLPYFSDFLEVLRASSISEAADKLRASEERFAKEQQQGAQQQQQAEAQAAQEERAFTSEEAQKNRDHEEFMLRLKLEGEKEQDVDAPLEEQLKPVEALKHDLSERQFGHQVEKDNRELEFKARSLKLDEKKTAAEVDKKKADISKDKQKLVLDNRKIKVAARARSKTK